MFQLEFMQNAFAAGLIISILCPFIGLFLVLRRYSMIGDTLSHSSLAGVAIGLVVGINPIITAFLFTTLCAIIIEFLRGYYKKYAEFPYIPFWSMIKYLSLGELYTLYLGLNPFLQANICKNYKMNPITFATWLKDLSLVRNLCAHNQRLWKRKFDFCNEELNIKQLTDKLILFLNNEPYKRPNEKFLENLQARLNSLLG